jgi:hypothetical protein
MNKLEHEMCDLLKSGRDHYGWVAVKAEFEAEGTRLDELLRLIEIARKADLKVALKIGGCEALMDLYTAKQVGADFVIAPMIESSYALSKFIAAVSKAYSEFEVGDTDFLWNIETGLAFKNLDSMVQVATQSRVLKGIVFGRNDYCGSIGQDSSFVNHESITADGVKMAQKCRDSDLDLVVGGGVSIDSIPALNELDRFRLTRFETRKVIFSSEALKIEKLEEGMILALKFELMWLTNKRDYYSAIYNEDQKRFEALTTRWGINP